MVSIYIMMQISKPLSGKSSALKKSKKQIFRTSIRLQESRKKIGSVSSPFQSRMTRSRIVKFKQDVQINVSNSRLSLGPRKKTSLKQTMIIFTANQQCVSHFHVLFILLQQLTKSIDPTRLRKLFIHFLQTRNYKHLQEMLLPIVPNSWSGRTLKIMEHKVTLIIEAREISQFVARQINRETEALAREIQGQLYCYKKVSLIQLRHNVTKLRQAIRTHQKEPRTISQQQYHSIGRLLQHEEQKLGPFRFISQYTRKVEQAINEFQSRG